MTNLPVMYGSARKALQMRCTNRLGEPPLPFNPNIDFWPPATLRKPTLSGACGTHKFAFFADKRRLLIESDGNLQIFDSGVHQIREVDEIVGERPTLEFISQNGRHLVRELKLIN